MTHRGPFQPLLFCDSVIWSVSPAGPGSVQGALSTAPGSGAARCLPRRHLNGRDGGFAGEGRAHRGAAGGEGRGEAGDAALGGQRAAGAAGRSRGGGEDSAAGWPGCASHQPVPGSVSVEAWGSWGSWSSAPENVSWFYGVHP